MAKKKREWSFDDQVKKSIEGLKNTRSLESQVRLLRTWLNEPGRTPQTLAPILSDSVGITRRYEAVVSSASEPAKAWPRLHLVWRYEAFQWRVYIDRATELASEYLARGSRGKLSVGRIGCIWFNSILMTMAFAACLGEDEAAYWFGDWCQKTAQDPPLFVEKDAWSTGVLEPFLLRLYCLWRARELPHDRFVMPNHGPYVSVFQAWNNAEKLDEICLKLCQIHAAKVVHFQRPDDDFIFGLQYGLYCEFPVEILFLQRVRKDLGLSVPNPDHPLLRSPLTSVPFPCPHSGYDPCMAEVYGRCKQLMPSLNIPWEEKYQSLGLSDADPVPPLEIG